MGMIKNSKASRVASYIEEWYKKLDPQIKDTVFKGGIAQATTAFMSICVMGGSRSPEDSTREDVAKVLSIYINSALSLSSSKSADETSTYLCNIYSKYVKDDKRAKAMISFTMLNQVDPAFSALKQENVNVILDNIRNLDAPKQNKNAKDRYVESSRKTSEAVGKEYSFANKDEFMIYVAVEKPTDNIRWLSNDKYVKAFKRGYSLVDSGNLQEAVAAFNQAISCNPVAIDARFELINCYFGLKRLDAALGSLHYLERYLGRKTDIAHYYRCFGYYFVEINDIKRGAAAYQLSLEYDNNPTGYGELMALCSTYSINLENTDIRVLVQSGGAAILTPWYDEAAAEALKSASEEPPAHKKDDTFRCPKCHRVLPKDSDFCQYCGTPVNNDASPTTDLSDAVLEEVSDDSDNSVIKSDGESEAIRVTVNETNAEEETADEEIIPAMVWENRATEKTKEIKGAPADIFTDHAEPIENKRSESSESIKSDSIVRRDTHHNDTGHVREQNKLFYVIIGLLVIVIILLIIFILKPDKNTSAIKETTTVAAETTTSVKTTASAETTATNEPKPPKVSVNIEGRIEDAKAAKEETWPAANPSSMEKLDPWNCLAGGRLFGSPIAPIIKGKVVDKDYHYQAPYDGSSLSFYQFIPGPEYFGISEDGTSVVYYVDEQTGEIIMLNYIFILPSNETEIYSLFEDIIQEIEKSYGKKYDLAYLDDGESDTDPIWIYDTSEFRESLTNKVNGEYHFVWLFSNYDVSLILQFDPDNDTCGGYVSYELSAEE